MDRNELYRLIQQKEKEYDRAKLKRFVLTVLGYGVAFCAIILLQTSDDISVFSLEIMGAYLEGVIIAGVFVFFSIPVFSWLFERSATEKKTLKDLEEQLNDMSKKTTIGGNYE